MNRIIAALAVMLLMLLSAARPSAAHAAEADAGYRVAIVPGMPASEVRRRWQPLLDALSRLTGLNFQLRFHEDFGAFEQALAQDDCDFALMTSMHAWQFRQQFRPLVHGKLALTGVIVVNKDSPLRTAHDLNGRILSVQDSQKLLAVGQVMGALREQKISPRLLLVKTEGNAIRNVTLQKAEAAAISNYALHFSPDALSKQLRVIYETPNLPPPPFSASTQVPADIQQKVRQALLQLQATQPQLLQEAMMPGLSPADFDREYSGIGKLMPGEGGHVRH